MYGNVDWVSADYDDKVGDGLYEKNWSTCSEKHLLIQTNFRFFLKKDG